MAEVEPLRVICEMSADRVEVREGDVYEWRIDVNCRSGRVMKRGERLHVIQRTKDTPHNEISFSGWNWVCREGLDGPATVWATLEQCIQRDLLKKVK